MQIICKTIAAAVVLCIASVASAESIATVQFQNDNVRTVRFLASLRTPTAATEGVIRADAKGSPEIPMPPVVDPPEASVVEEANTPESDYHYPDAPSAPYVSTPVGKAQAGCGCSPVCAAAPAGCCVTPTCCKKSCCALPLLSRLLGRRCNKCSAPSCSMCAAPTCGCDAGCSSAGPSCGCDAAGPSCGCDAVGPSCGLDVAPSCGCDAGSTCGTCCHKKRGFPILSALLTRIRCAAQKAKQRHQCRKAQRQQRCAARHCCAPQSCCSVNFVNPSCGFDN